ncbi:MAG: hypothetical protein AB1468_06890 [Candidatus Micrarchaeota archaeon]
MKVSFSEKARADFSRMDAGTRRVFYSHIEKLERVTPRKHLRFGIPFFVENVGSQGRIVLSFDESEIIVIRCFRIHKEYEKWYNAFR